MAGSYAQTFATHNGYQFQAQEVAPTNTAITPATVTMMRGQYYTLSSIIEPTNFAGAIERESTDANVVTVGQYGRLYTCGTGTATVKLVAGDVYARCAVTVEQPVNSVRVRSSSVSLEGRETFRLTANVYPSNALDRSVTWTSSDEAIAMVDQDGVVRAHRKGTAEIRATANDGSGCYGSCTVTVTRNVFVVTTPDELESEHNYANNCDDAWTYTLPGVTALSVTFDERTHVEDGSDYIRIYTGAGVLAGSFTGAQLSGRSVMVLGDTVRIVLVSDSSATDWGFKVTSVARAKVAIVPSAAAGLVYTGARQVGVASGEGYELAGTTFATDTGSYVATATPIDGWTWTDGTTDAADVYWGIDQATGSLSVESDLLSLEAGAFGDASLAFVGDGTVRVTPEDERAARASYDADQGKAIVIGVAAGSTTVTVELEGSVNYTTPDPIELFVNVTGESGPAPSGKSLSDATFRGLPASATYTGMHIVPTFSLTYNGAELSYGTDYFALFGNKLSAGTASVAVFGLGEYTGWNHATFTIYPANIKTASPSMQTSATYTGK